ncbi:MAG: endonuclease/exonuclease/phosphatase [Candidatus Gerdarchaeota archaeon]|nr:MAG: endonuclease/exonuclease/phosphatase [Candidatus Gerdarchaeota archaeon]
MPNKKPKKRRHRKGEDNENSYYISWWNVENLFDTENYPDRSDKLKRTIGNEIKGWNNIVLNKKLRQLADIIELMNDKRGPDILGVCEVENAHVLQKLIEKIKIKDRNYQIVHHDCSDNRGVDVAFIYDANRLEKGLTFSHVIMKRVATRDIFQVNFKTKKEGNDLILVGNHWPARSGGILESEPYRIVAGETLSYWNYRIQQILGDQVAIIALGDFNDEPFNRSLTDYALSTSTKDKVISATKRAPRFFNLMWQEMGKGLGTHYYQNFPTMLDQFLISKGFLVEDGAFEAVPNSIEIIRFEKMRVGKYGVPRRFGRPTTSVDFHGYSDHFPIGMKIVEK